MLRKRMITAAVISLFAMTTALSFQGRSAAQGFTHQFSFKEITVVGSKNPPNFMEVSWSLTGLKPGARIEGYELIVNLSGNGQTGKVVQTPSPNITSVSVGLLGIPNDARAKIFGGPSRATANISLTAKIIHNGTRSSIGIATSRNFNPLSSQEAPAPKPKPTPNLDLIREGLKKKERVVIKPVPTPKPSN